MSETPEIRALALEWIDGDMPYSPDFGDHFYCREDGRAECGHVFLAGNGLPERWATCGAFTIGELGFGTGLNFCETWRVWKEWARAPRVSRSQNPSPSSSSQSPLALGDFLSSPAGGEVDWRQPSAPSEAEKRGTLPLPLRERVRNGPQSGSIDPVDRLKGRTRPVERSEALAEVGEGSDPWLHFISFELHPMKAHSIDKALSRWPELDMERQALVAKWPDEPGGVVEIAFSENVRLSVICGDAFTNLSASAMAFDAWYLDGFAPSRNPAMWSEAILKSVFDHTRPGGSFATYAAAGFVRRNLVAAGFAVERRPGFAGKREMLCGIKATAGDQ